MGEYIRRKVRVAISEEELKETRAAWDWRWGEVEWHEYVEESGKAEKRRRRYALSERFPESNGNANIRRRWHESSKATVAVATVLL
jgi:hypothetical protein